MSQIPAEIVELEEAIHAEGGAAGDCFCSWMNESEKKRSELRMAAVTESRTEAIRLLRLAEQYAGTDPGLLAHIAMSWKDLGTLYY